MVNHQRDHLQCQTDQSRMSSIGSPTPLSIVSGREKNHKKTEKETEDAILKNGSKLF